MMRYNLKVPTIKVADDFAPLIRNMSPTIKRLLEFRISEEERANELAVEYAYYVDKQLMELERNLNMLLNVRNRKLRQRQAEAMLYMFVESLRVWQLVNSRMFLHSAVLSHANNLQDIYVGQNIGLSVEPSHYDDVEWFDKTYIERVDDNAKAMFNVLNRELTDRFTDNEPIDFMWQDLKITEKVGYGIYSFHRFIVGEVYRAGSFVDKELYPVLESSGYIKEVEWVSVLDSKTCGECEDLDGTIYGIDDLVHLPPIHAWCRCIVAGVV